MLYQLPTLTEIWGAHRRMRHHILRTPLRQSLPFTERFDADIFLKLENWQPTGSFKVRGAFNLVSQLSPEERARGLVAASAGNHGAAVGYAANRLGIDNVHIFVPGTTPRAKVQKIKRYGGHVHEVGETYDDAHHAAAAYEQEHNATFVHAYDDSRTIAGAGTTALEILEDVQDLDAILVPVGGGGLIAGIAVAIKQLARHIRVIAVQPDASPALRDSLRDGICYEEYSAGPTICDGLAGGIGQTVFQAANAKLIDEVLIVPERAVQESVAAFAGAEQLIVEGSGAVGLAAVQMNPSLFRHKRVALVVTGANIDAGRLSSILSESV